MHIGFIVEPYEEKESSGLAYVTAQYAKGLVSLGQEHSITLYSKEPFRLFDLPTHVRNVIVPKSFLGKNWYFLKTYFLHKDMFPDVLAFNMPLLPLVLPSKVKTVVYCHEVLFEAEISKLSQRMLNGFWRFLAFYTMRHAAIVCTATQAVAEEIKATYKINDAVIRVIPHGIRLLPETISADTSFEAPYFSFVGRTKYKKNMHGTIEGFLRFKEATKCPHVLCLVGKTKDTPYLMHWLGEAKRRGFGDAIVRTGFVPEERLLSILKGSTALVFCSLAEGFGLPVAEAMSMGVPVITSTIPVLAEVAGDAALLADPHDPQTIADAMASLAQGADLRAQLSEKGRARAATFTWPKAQDAFARATLDTQYL